MTEPVLLEARNVSKSFGAHPVLHDVSFDVRRGEVLGVLGPNGAGKTTLFNVISGDHKASGGTISSMARRSGPSLRSGAAGSGSGGPTRSRSPIRA